VRSRGGGTGEGVFQPSVHHDGRPRRLAAALCAPAL